MNIKHFQKEQKYKNTKNILIAYRVVIFLILIFISYSILEKNNQTKTIFIPMQNTSEFYIQNQNANDQYIQNYIEYIIILWQEVTPTNIERRFEKLLSYIDSENYYQIKKQLANKINKIKKYKNNRYSVAINTIKIDRKNQEIIAKITKNRWTDSKGIKEKKDIDLLINYKINQSTFYITKMEEIQND